MFRAALALSLGLWTGIRAWRPPSWWAIAIAVFLLATWWFLGKRAWLAKTLALATWFLFGAFLIQIRGSPPEDPHLSALSDGRPLTLTAHVIHEGYARATSPRETRQSIDVETEAIESDGQSWPVRAGIRLSFFGRTDHGHTDRGHTDRGHTDDGRANNSTLIEEAGEANANPIARDTRNSPAEFAPLAAPALALTYGTRVRIRAKLHPARNFRNPGAFDYEGYLRDNRISVLGSARLEDVALLPGFPAAVSRSGAPASTPVSSQKFISSGPPSRPRSWTPWFSAKSPSCATPPAPSSSAPVPTICS